MYINFDCIQSIIESVEDENIKVIGFTTTNDSYSYYECLVYNNLIVFTVKSKSDSSNKMKCIKFCNIISEDNLYTSLNLSPNLLRNKLNNIDKCIINISTNECSFDKSECFKKIN